MPPQPVELTAQPGAPVGQIVPGRGQVHLDFTVLDERRYSRQERVGETHVDAGARARLGVEHLHAAGVVLRAVEGVELQNLAVAIRLYYERSMRAVYRLDPYSGVGL